MADDPQIPSYSSFIKSEASAAEQNVLKAGAIVAKTKDKITNLESQVPSFSAFQKQELRSAGKKTKQLKVTDNYFRDAFHKERAERLTPVPRSIKPTQTTGGAGPAGRYLEELAEPVIGFGKQLLGIGKAVLTGKATEATKQTYETFLKPQVEQFQKAADLYHQQGAGMPSAESVAHVVAGLLPGYGPMAAGAGEQLGRGDIRGFSQSLILLAVPFVGKAFKALKAGTPAEEAMATLKEELKTALPEAGVETTMKPVPKAAEAARVAAPSAKGVRVRKGKAKEGITTLNRETNEVEINKTIAEQSLKADPSGADLQMRARRGGQHEEIHARLLNKDAATMESAKRWATENLSPKVAKREIEALSDPNLQRFTNDALEEKFVQAMRPEAAVDKPTFEMSPAEKAATADAAKKFSKMPKPPRAAGIPSTESPLVGAPTLTGGSGGPGLLNKLKSLTDRFGPKTMQPVPKAPGGLRAGIANTFISNFNHLKRATTAGWESVLKTAGSRAQAGIMTKQVVPMIEKATGMKFDQFASVLAESRLRGIRERFETYKQDILNATPQELQEALSSKYIMGDVLDSLAQTHNFPSDLRAEAMANLVEGPESLRAYLADLMGQAAAKVGHFRLGPDAGGFEKITSNPKFQEGLKLYKEHIEKPLSDAHKLNEGWESDALGPLETYFPLIAKDVETGLPRRLKGIGQRTREAYQKPRNQLNRFATGQAADYSVQVSDLHDMLTGAFKSNNTANLLTTLESEGWLSPHQGGEVPRGYVVRNAGPLRTITTKSTDVRSGSPPAGGKAFSQLTRSVDLPRKQVVVPEWMARELDPLLEPGRTMWTSEGYRNFVGKMTGWALKGLAEPAFHSAKIVKDLTTTTPFIGKSIVSKSVGSVPFIKYGNTIAQLVNEGLTEADTLRIQGKLAEAGVIPTRYGSDIRGLGKVLFGEHGLDARARVLAYKMLEQVEPNPTPAMIHDFVGQVGIYNRALESAVSRFTKDVGAGTFYSAGVSRLRNGLNAWTLRSKLPEGHPALRVAQALSGGATGTVLTWVGAYKAYTGKWPWQDPRAKLLQVPLNDNDRQSKVAQLLYGPGNKTAYISLDWGSHVAGGARALGLAKAFEINQEGGTVGQSIEAGAAQSLSTMVQPGVSGPMTHDVSTALLGVAPYLTGFRDPITGRPSPQFFETAQKKEPGLPQIAENLTEAVIGTNSFIGSLGGVLDFGERGKQDEQLTTGGRGLKLLLNLALPGLIKAQMDLEKRQQSLQRQQKAAAGVKGKGSFGGQ